MNISNSSRLSYSFISETDSEFLFQLDQNPNVMRYINGGKPTSKSNIVDLFILRLYAYRNQEKGWGLWKVAITETQENIGWILVRPMNFFTDTPDFNDMELGWRFIESSWRKGYATEAAKHVQQTMSENTQYQFFSATALKENSASIEVMKKIGMSFVKTYIHTDDNLSNGLSEQPAVLYRMKNKKA